MRVQHLALLMITLGLGLLTYELANAMAWLTGGTDGLRGVDTWPILGTFDFDLWGYTAYGYALIVLFIGLLVARRIVHSSFGLSLRGVRENVRRMPAIGSDYRVHLQKIYTISAAMAGVAGRIADADDQHRLARHAELPAVGRRGGHADTRRHGAALWRHHRRASSSWSRATGWPA